MTYIRIIFPSIINEQYNIHTFNLSDIFVPPYFNLYIKFHSDVYLSYGNLVRNMTRICGPDVHQSLSKRMFEICHLKKKIAYSKV